MKTDIASGKTTQGIALMCAGIFCLTLSDAFGKALVARYDPFQMLFLRNLLSLPMVMAVILVMDGRAGFVTRRPGVHAVRGVLALGALWCFFTALKTMGLGEATALVLTAPLCVTGLSVVLLGERVGPLRWGALIVGFAGAMVIVQPGAGALDWVALLPLAAAFFYALVMIGARWIDPAESPRTMMFYLAFFPFVICAIWVLWAGLPMPDGREWGLTLGMALTGPIGITMLTQAFRIAPPSVVAPFDYTALLWASGLGYLVWAEVPALTTWIGGLVIVFAGLFVWWREHA